MNLLANSTGAAIIAYKQCQLNSKFDNILAELVKSQEYLNTFFSEKIEKIVIEAENPALVEEDTYFSKNIEKLIETNENIYKLLLNFIENKKKQDVNILNQINQIVDGKNDILLKSFKKIIEDSNNVVNVKLDQIINKKRHFYNRK